MYLQVGDLLENGEELVLSVCKDKREQRDSFGGEVHLKPVPEDFRPPLRVSLSEIGRSPPRTCRTRRLWTSLRRPPWCLGGRRGWTLLVHTPKEYVGFIVRTVWSNTLLGNYETQAPSPMSPRSYAPAGWPRDPVSALVNDDCLRGFWRTETKHVSRATSSTSRSGTLL